MIFTRLLGFAVQFSSPTGRRGLRSRAVSTNFGGHSEGETPLPIPNRAVKPLSADGTWDSRPWESRSPPFLILSRPAGRLFLWALARPPGFERDERARADARFAGWRRSARADRRRRPSAAAAEVPSRRQLSAAGVAAAIEPFRRLCSFVRPVYGPLTALALVPGLLPRTPPDVRAAMAAAAAGLLAAEGGLVRTPLSAVLSRCPSANVVATIEPRAEARRTLCLIAHPDTSRSGLLFASAAARADLRSLTVRRHPRSPSPALAPSR